MDDTLRRDGEYFPFYCGKHGKFLSNLPLLKGVRGLCPVCEQPCFTPEEWQYRYNATMRELRERRVQLLRNYLE